MRGAYYAVSALLVTASSHTVAEVTQAESLQTPNNEFVASSGTLHETLPIRESRDVQDDLALNEERTPTAPRSSLKKLEPTVIDAVNVLRTDEEDVIAKAAKAIEFHREWMPILVAETSKRKRVDPTPNDVDEQALHDLPYLENSFVSVANNMPIVLAKRLDRGEPPVIKKNAAKSKTQYDYRLAPIGPSTTTSTAPGGRLNNQLITQKVSEIGVNKHPNVVSIRKSKHQRIDPPYNVGGVALYALPNPEEAPVWVASNVPIVLSERLKIKPPTMIMNNAAESIAKHDFRPGLSSPSTSIEAASAGRVNKQLTFQKALDLGMNTRPDKMNSHSVAHLSHMRAENTKSTHLTTVNGESVSNDWMAEVAKGPRFFKTFPVNDEVLHIHKAFLKAFRLPFHQNPQETAKMMKLVQWHSNASPMNSHSVEAFKILAGKQNKKKLEELLRPDLKDLLSNEELVLEKNEKNLRHAYIVKLVIMFELFYDFCHNNKNLFENLPTNVDRKKWILKLSSTKSGSSEDQIIIPHD